MSNCTPSDINYFLLACLSSRFSWIRLSPQNNQMRLNHHTQETHFFQFMFMIWECFTIFIVLLLGLLIMVILIYISCLSRYQIYYECLFTDFKISQVNLHMISLVQLQSTVFLNDSIPLRHLRYPLSLCYRKVIDVSSKLAIYLF